MARNIRNALSARLRERLISYVAQRKRIHPKDAEDFIQNVVERVLASRKLVNEGYYWEATKSLVIDSDRKANRHEQKRAKVLQYESELEDLLQTCDLSAPDRSILDLLAPWRLGQEYLSLREASKQLGIGLSALRQRSLRALKRIRVELLVKWYKEGNLKRLNEYRLSDTLMADVRRRTARLGLGNEVFLHAFKYPDFSVALQNSIWALASRAKSPRVVSFFKRQLTNEDLFRGTRTYVADALFGYRDPEVDHFVNRNYFGAVREMRSREFDPNEPVPIGTRTLYDVRNVRIIGSQASIDVARVKADFLSADVDLHRAAAFALLRIAPDDENIGGMVVNHLSHEWDQTNAYYTTKFLMRVGLRKLPHVYANKATLEAVRAAAQNWPGNFYLKESAARISSRLS